MVTIVPPLDIRSLPYSQRQLIIIQPDQVVEAAREAEANASSGSETTDWMEIAAQVGKAALIYPSLYGIVIEHAVEALKAWAKARESGLDVLQIGQSEAVVLQFPPGHYRQQTLYVAHPAIPDVYYTTAAFHRMTFEHKFSEAIQLLMSLGASHIAVEHVHGWSRDFSAKMSAPLPEAEANLSASTFASNSSRLLFEAAFDNKAAPTLPTNLVWYPHEPTWQTVAKGRLQFGMQHFSLTVNYEDDFGVNAGLKLRSQKAGFELGGAFEDHMRTAWKIHGKFAGNESG
ncbi:MAG TPA: hypothetical protein VFQ97_04835 [Gallionella sp.]|nr:hypothetical protein [Gallionella sp.]